MSWVGIVGIITTYYKNISQAFWVTNLTKEQSYVTLDKNIRIGTQGLFLLAKSWTACINFDNNFLPNLDHVFKKSA